ncbi:INSulin related [Caenorhabditis elegans]|uniref:INSulin related n=1 Tax=Caenorhabditis elegans TaxID=6239 RepID=Q9XUE8_CAEEL|nr:INSulin related [Caenorhabditis elegans]CAB05196.2 INSulin related [Caenorhabditis elegans]|eukprot:NP_502702.2 INSulin related [Caenorhabditis elegans]
MLHHKTLIIALLLTLFISGIDSLPFRKHNNHRHLKNQKAQQLKEEATEAPTPAPTTTKAPSGSATTTTTVKTTAAPLAQVNPQCLRRLTLLARGVCRQPCQPSDKPKTSAQQLLQLACSARRPTNEQIISYCCPEKSG